MVQIYTEPLCRRHFVSIVSFAVFIRIFLLCSAIGLALVVAYATGGFWVKIQPTLDQATVHYTNDALLVFQGALPDESYVWSTSPIIQQQFASSFIPANVQYGEEDWNFDGKPDVLQFSFSVQAPVPIFSVKALVQVTYSYNSNVMLDMFSLAYVSASSAQPGGVLSTDGDLVLNQRSPITNGKYNDLYNFPMLTSVMPPQQQAVSAANQLEFDSIIGSYLNRNYTTFYGPTYNVWSPGSGNSFVVSMTVRIPPNQVIWYRPQVIEMLKFAWIQWLATFIVLWWLYSFMEAYIFRYRLVNTRVQSDVQPRMQKY